MNIIIDIRHDNSLFDVKNLYSHHCEFKHTIQFEFCEFKTKIIRQIKFCSNIIEWSKNIKYLSITFDKQKNYFFINIFQSVLIELN